MRDTAVNLQYQLQKGQYCLYDMAEAPSTFTGERRCRLKTDAVALAFDRITGEVHQHGKPEFIHLWAKARRRKLRADGALDQANRIVVISGPLPVEEINRCLGHRGYSVHLLRRLPELHHGKYGVKPPQAPNTKARPSGTDPSRSRSSGHTQGAWARSGMAFA
jgi:hypothetical protein